jgi:hypothetical protein
MSDRSRGRDRDTLWVAAAASLIALAALAVYFRRDQLLLFWDAEGHINIARRVLDSRYPGLLQLGTVWLPLPHLLLIPFVWPDWLWRTAVGGAIPSMIAYVFAAVGMFRLVRRWVRGPERVAAWLAVLVLAGNPSLIYLQTTAMTETLYLALLVWTAVHLDEFVRIAEERRSEAVAARSLRWCGVCLAAAMLTRYDGWSAAMVTSAIVLWVGIRAGVWREPRRELRRGMLVFAVLLVVAGGGWLLFNALVYGNALEFATGLYSARAIEQRLTQAPHPGTGNPAGAALYFLKAVQANLAVDWAARVWLALAAIGSVVAGLWHRRWAVLLLLWSPLPFYILAIAWGGVPVFVPEWWPFSSYNLRYGVELLPAVAVSVALLAGWAMQRARRRPVRVFIAAAVVMLWAWSATGQWRVGPASFLEAAHNRPARIELERWLGAELARLPGQAVILMSLRDYPGALERAGIPLRRVIHEETQRGGPAQDRDSLWARALRDPHCCADFAVGFAAEAQWKTVDPVFAAWQRGGSAFEPVAEFKVAGEPRVLVYRVR